MEEQPKRAEGSQDDCWQREILVAIYNNIKVTPYMLFLLTVPTQETGITPGMSEARVQLRTVATTDLVCALRDNAQIYGKVAWVKING